jgi:hypothetical protein
MRENARRTALGRLMIWYRGVLECFEPPQRFEIAPHRHDDVDPIEQRGTWRLFAAEHRHFIRLAAEGVSNARQDGLVALHRDLVTSLALCRTGELTFE